MANLDKTLDPRLLFEDSIQPAGSPMDISASRMPSSDMGENGKSLYFTHLVCRQPIVNTIRIHPNLNLRNLFGNLPFSSSVRANNYPVDVQDSQIDNLFIPTWAMMPVNTKPDPGSVKLAFPGIVLEASALLKSGAPVELVLETHPNIAALFDEEKFNASGILSKWAAGMVHSMMLKGEFFNPSARLLHISVFVSDYIIERLTRLHHRKQFYVFCIHVSFLVPDALDNLPVSRNIRDDTRLAPPNVRCSEELKC
jgi:hypothetical protein